MPYMKSLSTCLNRVVHEGYTDDFKITEEGLASSKNNTCYQPNQIQVVNFYRFEGESDPADNAILYVIETSDGTKGTIIDAFGPYNDSKVSRFMKDVQHLKKQTHF